MDGEQGFGSGKEGRVGERFVWPFEAQCEHFVAPCKQTCETIA